MPALMCCRAAFVCVDDLFCGLPFKRFVPQSVAQEKAFKVMDALDAQARKFAILFCVAVNTEPCREHQI